MRWQVGHCRAVAVNLPLTVILLLFFGSLFTTHCISFQNNNHGPVAAYLKNRVMDSGDIFSLGFSTHAYGAKAVVSSSGLGLYFESPRIFYGDPPHAESRQLGLQNGEIGLHRSSDFTLIVAVSEKSEAEDRFKRRRQAARSKEKIILGIQAENPKDYTRIGLAAGLYLGLRMECNVGELLDFLLGFLGIDIYSDDIYRADKAVDKTVAPTSAKERLPPLSH